MIDIFIIDKGFLFLLLLFIKCSTYLLHMFFLSKTKIMIDEVLIDLVMYYLRLLSYEHIFIHYISSHTIH